MQGILQQKGGFWRQNQLELSRQLLHLGSFAHFSGRLCQLGRGDALGVPAEQRK